MVKRKMQSGDSNPKSEEKEKEIEKGVEPAAIPITKSVSNQSYQYKSRKSGELSVIEENQPPVLLPPIKLNVRHKRDFSNQLMNLELLKISDKNSEA